MFSRVDSDTPSPSEGPLAMSSLAEKPKSAATRRTASRPAISCSRIVAVFSELASARVSVTSPM